MVNSVAVTPDGRCVISASSDGTLKIWDLTRGQAIQTFTDHTDMVNDVAVTPDGCFAVSVSFDLTLRVWDIKTSQLALTLMTDEPLQCCVVAPDGRTIIAGAGLMLGTVHFIEWVR
jgi:WD40 repeat protein